MYETPPVCTRFCGGVRAPRLLCIFYLFFFVFFLIICPCQFQCSRMCFCLWILLLDIPFLLALRKCLSCKRKTYNWVIHYGYSVFVLDPEARAKVKTNSRRYPSYSESNTWWWCCSTFLNRDYYCVLTFFTWICDHADLE